MTRNAATVQKSLVQHRFSSRTMRIYIYSSGVSLSAHMWEKESTYESPKMKFPPPTPPPPPLHDGVLFLLPHLDRKAGNTSLPHIHSADMSVGCFLKHKVKALTPHFFHPLSQALFFRRIFHSLEELSECLRNFDHRSTKRGQIEKTGTKEITMQGCSYDPKGSFGSEKVGA